MSAIVNQPRYQLAAHVHTCRTRDYVVLLDSRQNKYAGVGRPAMTTFAHLIEGWPSDGDDSVAGQSTDEQDLLSQLLREGMIVAGTHAVRSSPRELMPAPQLALVDGYSDSPADLRWREITNFLRAMLLGSVLRRFRSMERVGGYIRRRRSAGEMWGETVTDLEEIRRRVQQFQRLRPILFTSRNACLLDSLALSCFLSSYGIFPRCVFGVVTGPFTAHCWLQQADVVINDSLERVRAYTPILVL